MVRTRPSAGGARAGAEVVVIMAKTPVAGQVKTRLQAVIGPGRAVDIARAMLADTVDNALAVTDEVVVATAGDLHAMATVVPACVSLHRQVGTDLAERLTHAQSLAFAGGAERVLLLGADCPTVEPALLREAFDVLGTATAALVPAADGGYTLLSAARPTPELFAGVVMGRADVAERTLAAARAHTVGVVVLPVRHDLDRVEDFVSAGAAGQLGSAPRTRDLVTGWPPDPAC